MAKKNGEHVESAAEYATAADFKKIFTEDVNSLYLLSLLLTGDPEKAEKCFVEGIAESTKGNHVFKEWARSWARRTIVQSAVRLISLRERPVTAIRSGNAERVMDKVPIILHAEVGAILELAPLERFVFVMSVLERYSDNDCSILLGCARRDIATARAHAIQQLATSLRLKSSADAGLENSAASEDAAMVTELMIAHHFAAAAWSGSLYQ